MPTKVLITGKLHPTAVEALVTNKLLDVKYEPDCGRIKTLELINDAVVHISRSETDVDRECIDHGKKLKILVRAAVGVGNIDVEYATSKGILVMNTPGKNTNSAAEMTLALMMAMFRQVPSAQAKVKSGGWDRHIYTGRELRNKRVGIVGLGNVGHRVAQFCKGFDMEVSAYDPYISMEVFDRHGVKPYRSLEDMVAHVDILTVHVPKNKETTGLITSQLLLHLPKNSWFLNLSRGGIADESDLLEVVNSGHLAGVALDTYCDEPNPLKQLIAHEKVWCTPHIGASTTEAQIAIGESVVEQVNKAVSGGVVDYPVNLPEIGVMDKPILKAYSVLAEKLGSMIGQLIRFNPRSVEMHYRGDIADLDNALLRLSLMKGYANHVVDGYVSVVNAKSHFDAMGITVEEAKDPQFSSYKSALKVVIRGAGDESLTIGGIVFDDRYLRISLVDGFYFELEPVGTMLLIENKDRPGVIGQVGQFLSDRQINISSFALSRNRKGGKAMAVVCIDSELDPAAMTQISQIENIESARSVSL